MALKATKNQGTVAPQVTQPAPQEVQEQPAVTVVTPPAVTAPAQAPAPRTAGAGNPMANINAGILDNIDDLTVGNYVSIDGSEFLYKAREEHVREIDIIVAYGKRFYQYFDEENNKYHNSDTKLDDRYKMKFEIRWYEENEDGEPAEHIMSLPTASAMNFIQYAQGLARKGIGVGQIVTRMTISRQTSKEGNKKYSRVEFENIGSAE